MHVDGGKPGTVHGAPSDKFLHATTRSVSMHLFALPCAMHEVLLGHTRSPHFDDPPFKQPATSAATKIPRAICMVVLIGSSRSVRWSHRFGWIRRTRRRRYSSRPCTRSP